MRMLKSYSKHNHQTVQLAPRTANISVRMTAALIGPQFKQDLQIQILQKMKIMQKKDLRRTSRPNPVYIKMSDLMS